MSAIRFLDEQSPDVLESPIRRKLKHQMIKAKIQVFKGKEAFTKHCVIGQDSLRFKFWNLFFAGASIFSSYYYMFLSSFKSEDLSRTDPVDIGFIMVFTCDLILNFFTEKKVTKDHHEFTERDLRAIAAIYLRNGFVFDLMTLLPFFQFCRLLFPHSNLVYLMKVFKFKAGIKIIDAESFIKHFRSFSKQRAQNLAKSNPQLASDKTKNQTYSTQMVYAL